MGNGMLVKKLSFVGSSRKDSAEQASWRSLKIFRAILTGLIIPSNLSTLSTFCIVFRKNQNTASERRNSILIL